MSSKPARRKSDPKQHKNLEENHFQNNNNTPDLDKVLGSILGGVEIHPRVVDQDVDLSLLLVDLVPEGYNALDVGALHRHVGHILGLDWIYLLSEQF